MLNKALRTDFSLDRKLVSVGHMYAVGFYHFLKRSSKSGVQVVFVQKKENATNLDTFIK